MSFYQAQYDAFLRDVNNSLSINCDKYLPQQARIAQAARYSLLGGGKRIRGVLTLASCQLAGADAMLARDFAAGLEMLHCYSLIHDDLPCMDDDDMRRGCPSCHIQYDEYTALLAGDALVTAAFECLANAPLCDTSRADACAILAKAAGARGMLYGQELDKKYEYLSAGEVQLRDLHSHKTGALIVSAVQLGCCAARADDVVIDALTDYAEEVGLVFQIVDDILDVTSTDEALGKPVGSDGDNDKTTFVTLYGLEASMQQAKEHTALALEALSPITGDTSFLRDFATNLLERKS